MSELDFKQLRKLYYRSCNVNAIAALLTLGVIVLSFTIPTMLMAQSGDLTTIHYLLIALTVFYVVTIIGVFKRSIWGRVLGILACALALINIPFGTLIGAVGLFAFAGAPQLFGPNRVTHKNLKAEFKRQELNRKLQKKAKKAGA